MHQITKVKAIQHELYLKSVNLISINVYLCYVELTPPHIYVFIVLHIVFIVQNVR